MTAGNPARQANFPALDALRFIAAFVVMLAHLRGYHFAPHGETLSDVPVVKTAFYAATRLGREFVLLFFVISGFLVGGISVEKFRQGRFDPIKYAIDRFSRIYVPLIPALALNVLILVVLGMQFSLGQLAGNILSLQEIITEPFRGNGALWSLSYEVWFYIILGAALVLFQARTNTTRWLAALALGLGFAVFCRLEPHLLFVWLGGLIGYFLPRPKRLWLLGGAGLVISLGGIALSQLTISSRQVDLAAFQFIDNKLAVLICGAGFTLVVAYASMLSWQGPAGRWAARVSALLASFSYTLYLVHLPVILLLRKTGFISPQTRFDLGALLAFGAAAGFIVLFSYVMYLMFERHTVKLRKILYGRWSRSGAAA